MTHSPRRLLPDPASLILLALSLALALLGTEAALRWAKAPDPAELGRMRQAAARDRGVAFDPRSTLEVLEALRAQGERAFPPVKPFNFLDRSLEVEGRELLPLAGVAEVTTVFNANETGERFVYRSDEYGFHNPPGLHRADGVDLAVIGDSFAQGVAVRSGQGVSEQIRRSYPRTLNLGMGASGPLVELAILHEYAEPLRPRIVLWLYYEANDLGDAVKEARNPILRQTLADEREPTLRAMAAPLDAALIRFAEAMIAEHQARRDAAPPRPEPSSGFFALAETRRRLSLLASSRTDDAPAPPSPPDPGTEDGLALFARTLRQAREWTAGWGGRLVVVYLPEYARFSRRWSISPDSARRDEVLALFAREGLPTIDLLPVFLAHDDPQSLFPFSLPGHYDAEGCRIAAEAIVSELAESELLTPRPPAELPAEAKDGVPASDEDDGEGRDG